MAMTDAELARHTAELVIRLNPGIDFDALAAAMTAESGLPWSRDDSAIGLALHGVRTVVRTLPSFGAIVSEAERARITALATEQQTNHERLLGAARVAALETGNVEHYLAAVGAPSSEAN